MMQEIQAASYMPITSTNTNNNTPVLSSNTCPSYFQLGYCLRGNDCPCSHDDDALSVPEMEFFFEWQVGEVFLQTYKRTKYEQEKEDEAKAREEARLSLEQERERIRRNAAIRKQQLEEEERREKKRLEKIEKRNNELKLEAERLAQLKRQKEQEQQVKESISASETPAEPVSSQNDSTFVTTSEEQIPHHGEEVVEDGNDFVLDEKYNDMNINWDMPRIPLSLKYHVPANFRQRILEKLVEAYLQKFNTMTNSISHRQKSVVSAIESELELYEKHREKSAYWINSISFISRLNN